MSLFFLKITLAPVLIAGATLIARRWGPVVGGWFVGLPLTSGPVSLFLALEQGAEFAATSAANALIGMCGIAIFSIVYAKSARGNAWARSCCFSLAVYFPVMEAFSRPSPGLPLECLFAFAFQAVTLLIVGRPAAVLVMRSPPWWDLPLRMGVAVAVVLLITGFAGALGPKWSGLLAPFPAFTLIMTVFAHQQHGPAAAHQILYGVVVGAFSAIAFFCIVAFGLTRMGPLITFTLAALATCAMNGLILALMLRRQRGH
ncbi:MAG: hypothetical protein LBC79_09820 [Deltaproteobacteria bacterium]|jgi:hypothetical protein|nr:hypothetical protein [Deltaproteobacteria bacterium]